MQDNGITTEEESDMRHKQRLQRRNAKIWKERPIIGSSSASRSYTATRSRIPIRKSVSHPTTPSQVDMNAVNDFSLVLRRNVPIVPDAVQLGPTVQNVQQALRNHEVQATRRRSARLMDRRDASSRIGK